MHPLRRCQQRRFRDESDEDEGEAHDEAQRLPPRVLLQQPDLCQLQRARGTFLKSPGDMGRLREAGRPRETAASGLVSVGCVALGAAVHAGLVDVTLPSAALSR
jgi:hypothetical protein